MQIKSYYKLIILLLAVLVLLVGFILYQRDFTPVEEPVMPEVSEDAVEQSWTTYQSAKWGFNISRPDYMRVSGEQAGAGRTFYDIDEVTERTSDVFLKNDEIIPGTIEIGTNTFWSERKEKPINIELMSVLPKKFDLTDEQANNFIETFANNFPEAMEANESFISQSEVILGNYKYQKTISEYFTGPGENQTKYNRIVYIYKDAPERLYIFSIKTEHEWALDLAEEIIKTFQVK